MFQRGLFVRKHSDSTRSNGYKLKEEKFGIILGGNSLLRVVRTGLPREVQPWEMSLPVAGGLGLDGV